MQMGTHLMHLLQSKRKNKNKECAFIPPGDEDHPYTMRARNKVARGYVRMK